MNETLSNFEYFIEIQNDEGITLDGIDDIFQLLFNKDDDTISNSLHVRGLRTSSNRCATFLIPLFAGLTAGIISTQWTFLIVGMTLMVLMLATLWIARDRL